MNNPLTPHCVYCESDPIESPVPDVYVCPECGETSYRSRDGWKPMYESVIQRMSDATARYFHRQLKAVRTYFRRRSA